MTAIVAGGGHSLALKANGTIVGWGNDQYGAATGVPTPADPYTSTGLVSFAGAPLSNVVALAAAESHSLALRGDGTVVGWGAGGPGASSDPPNYGQATVPAGVTNVVAIAAGWAHSLALKADGTVVGWGFNRYGQATGVPNTNGPYISSGVVTVGGQLLSNVVAIVAGSEHSLALKQDGTVVAWGAGGPGTSGYPNQGQATIPGGLSDVVAIAAGMEHSLALLSGGVVVAWGRNDRVQCVVPPSLTWQGAIETGDKYSLAVQSDGTVVGCGDDQYGEVTAIPASATNVVAVAAGTDHGLALRGNGTIVGWGRNDYQQRSIPAMATNAVAIAAGWQHSLALRADGAVIGWGYNEHGAATGVRTLYPYIASGAVTIGGTVLTNVAAIAAGNDHSLALKADGTVVGWGYNGHGQYLIPPGLTNVVAIAAGFEHSLFLAVTGSGGPGANGASPFVRAQIPVRVGDLFRNCNTNTLCEMGLDLHSSVVELLGVKALLAAVLELGMPYTLERDDVLHGFLYGSESLVDEQASRVFLQTENAELQAQPDARPQGLRDVAALRYQCFANRLNQCLTNLAAAGRPEIPRLVGHTLCLLDLLRDAWTQPTNSPPPALEMWSESGSPHLVLYGEPYTHYTLQYRDSLSVPGWTSTSIANLHTEDIVIMPVLGPSRFFRGLLPVP